MDIEMNYKIYVNKNEVNVIKDLLDILNSCPIDLNNDDYITIINDIAGIGNEYSTLEPIDGIQIICDNERNSLDLNWAKTEESVDVMEKRLDELKGLLNQVTKYRCEKGDATI